MRRLANRSRSSSRGQRVMGFAIAEYLRLVWRDVATARACEIADRSGEDHDRG
jgi:hypothetical protein